MPRRREGAEPIVAATQWRARDGYSCAVAGLQRAEPRKRHPRRRVGMEGLAAMALPKQLPARRGGLGAW
jgi:hypothetical protein